MKVDRDRVYRSAHRCVRNSRVRSTSDNPFKDHAREGNAVCDRAVNAGRRAANVLPRQPDSGDDGRCDHHGAGEPVLSPPFLVFARNGPSHLPHGSPPFGRVLGFKRSSWDKRPMKRSASRYLRFAPQSGHSTAIQVSDMVPFGVGMFRQRPLQATTNR